MIEIRTNIYDDIYLKVETAKNEVNLRVDSLKFELDRLNENMQNSLERIKNIFIK
jgi:hypothetical protein